MTKSDANPKSPVQRLREAPRCHARAKSTGERCKCPAVSGWCVCRVHGARGGHAAGPGASAVEAWWAVAGGDGGAAVGVNPGSIGLGDDGWVSSKDASDD